MIKTNNVRVIYTPNKNFINSHKQMKIIITIVYIVLCIQCVSMLHVIFENTIQPVKNEYLIEFIVLFRNLQVL